MYNWNLHKHFDWQRCNMRFVTIHFQNKQLILQGILIGPRCVMVPVAVGTTRQHNYVPLLSHIKTLWVSRNIWLYHKLGITRKGAIKTSRHIIKVCESVIKERRNLLYFWQQDFRWNQLVKSRHWHAIANGNANGIAASSDSEWW